MKYFLQYSLLILFAFACSTRSAQDLELQSAIEDHRTTYLQNFLKNERSPLQKEDLKNIRFFNAKAEYKVMTSVTLTPESKPFDLPTSSGKTKRFSKYALIDFQIKGEALQLSLYKNQAHLNHPLYKNLLFLPFKDLTNGKSSYGAGRFMDIKVQDIENGKLLLDFNKAYNPWCCYSDGYNCPIPPYENHLAIEIPAGEKNYKGKKKGTK